MAKSSLVVPAWLKAAIEDELRRYPITRIIIHDARQAILDQTPNKELGMPHGSGAVSDPTYAKVARLTSSDIVRLEWVYQAITDVCQILDDERRAVVDLYYWRRQPRYHVADTLGMSESTLWRVRQGIVQAIAYRMGALKPTWKWFRNSQRGAAK